MPTHMLVVTQALCCSSSEVHIETGKTLVKISQHFFEKTKATQKRKLLQASVIEGIENLRPMPPDNRVA